jgi:hypothetical protein
MAMTYDLQLSHVGKVYDNGTPAVIDFNLTSTRASSSLSSARPAAARRRRCA